MSLASESAFCIDIFSDLCTLLYTREIWLNGIIPYLTNLWNTSKPEIQILVSLFLQIFLIFYGNRRKHVAHPALQYGVWFAYQAADGVATSTISLLSAISQNNSSDPTFIVMMCWTPFLLLHLGGPDTISALQLEDNELWSRQSLQLLYQLLIAVLVVVRSWNGSHHLNYVIITVPMFIAGIIKCGERIWARRLGSYEYLRKSILPSTGPDPGPNYAKFMDEYIARKAEGYNVCLGKVIETSHVISGHPQGAIANDSIPDASAIHDGFYFFKIFKCLFADLSLSFQDHKSSRDFFRRDEQTWDHAFKVTEVELELMYDRLYTKAVVTYSIPGIVLKIVSFSFTLSAFITFCLLDKGQTNSDKIVTYVLFIAAILFEFYGFIVLLCSNWNMLRLSDIKNWKADLLYKIISCYQRCFKLSHTKRWRDEMSQFNFISFCVKDKPIKWIRKIPFFHKVVEMFYYQEEEGVPPKLKMLIFKHLKEKSGDASDIEACRQLCALRGDRVLKKWSSQVVKNLDKLEILDWSINKVDFDQSILLWHIATDLCYRSDEADSSNNVKLQSYITICRLLSNYMLYLLVISPSMLPTGIGQTRFEDTLAEASELLQEREYIKKRDQTCDMILRVNTEIPPFEVKGDRSKSVLFDACRLAKSLQSLESESDVNWTKEKKWEMMSHVWVEMLCHAACHCRGLLHAKKLSEGGEFLTHVWLLMAHFGITEQFQISQGHARAKLSLS